MELTVTVTLVRYCRRQVHDLYIVSEYLQNIKKFDNVLRRLIYLLFFYAKESYKGRERKVIYLNGNKYDRLNFAVLKEEYIK